MRRSDLSACIWVAFALAAAPAALAAAIGSSTKVTVSPAIGGIHTGSFKLRFSIPDATGELSGLSRRRLTDDQRALSQGLRRRG